MKRKLFLLLISVIILLLSGCGVIHLRGTVPNYEVETYTVTSGVKNVVLSEEDVSVQICPSDNGKMYFSYYCADDGSEKYEIEEEKGKVTITKKSKPNYGIFIFGDQYSSDSYKNVQLTAYIPDEYKGDLSIRTQDGDVSFNNTNIISELYCKTKDGNVKGVLAGKIPKMMEVTTKDGDTNISFEEKDKY